MKNKGTIYVVQAAVIAALYATLTGTQNGLLPGSASMAVQFRVSEVMTVLALFTPAAIPGLTVGCVLANISSLSSLGPYDMIFGTIATLFAALLMAALRKIRVWKIPVFSLLMPALLNGILVGFEIDFFFINNAAGFVFEDFLFQGGCVALGELGVLFVLGLPLVLLMEKKQMDKKLGLVPFKG